jgi:hypothetical protein
VGVSGGLTGSVPQPGPEPGPYAGDVYPLPPAQPPGDRITVYATVAVRTSAGPGPGVLELPAAEASRLVADRHAVYGSTPPRGFSDGGADPRVIAAMLPRTEAR